MAKTRWFVMAPGWLNKQFDNLEEVTEAAKTYLRNNPSIPSVTVQEFAPEKRGRIIFRVQDYFHYVNTEWIS